MLCYLTKAVQRFRQHLFILLEIGQHDQVSDLVYNVNAIQVVHGTDSGVLCIRHVCGRLVAFECTFNKEGSCNAEHGSRTNPKPSTSVRDCGYNQQHHWFMKQAVGDGGAENQERKQWKGRAELCQKATFVDAGLMKGIQVIGRTVTACCAN